MKMENDLKTQHAWRAGIEDMESVRAGIECGVMNHNTRAITTVTGTAPSRLFAVVIR